ncbi:interleukin-1 receptor-like 2 [Melanotaenia boesemani]|uniref:interleukin-1 receptor-like 2 n=1 Tax=Melanotaenia boesemani TaxID=1250792 RepID=UPI001C04CA2D|nr:interleukin-1 receptor-like 2 [Melanotaenia boesemani]
MDMISLNPAVFIFIQLIWPAFAASGTITSDYWNVSVSEGDSVVFNCNTSEKHTRHITWTKGRFMFSWCVQLQQNFSNFSDRVTMALVNKSKLKIVSAQLNDSGLYTCEITDNRGVSSITWNLTVFKKVFKKETSLLSNVVFIPSLAAGFLLCCTTAVICLCRKYGTRTENQNPFQDQFQSQTEEAVTCNYKVVRIIRETSGGESTWRG